MTAPDVAQIEAACARLRGQLVETPLIGELLLPGFDPPPLLRVKAETLQTAGSVHFRGAMHFLQRKLGALKGLVAHGEVRRLLAAGAAARLHRLPFTALPVGEPKPEEWVLLTTLGADVRPADTAEQARDGAEALRRAEGYAVMPGTEDADFAAGIATVGVELAAQLAPTVDRVAIAPAFLAEPLARGLAVAGRTIRVQGVDPDAVHVPCDLGDAVANGLRLCVGLPGLAALWWGLQQGGGHETAVVLAS